MVETARNPNWTRDELILALELYLKHRPRLPDQTHPDVVALSETLRSLGGQLSGGGATFRNTNGVGMKLANFRAFDPQLTEQGRRGLQRGSKGDAEVWKAFAERPDALQEAANAIRALVTAPTQESQLADQFQGVEAPEGALLTRSHLIRERSGQLPKKRKLQALAKDGVLRCEACGMTPASAYGANGDACIEVHHITPLHTLRPGSVTRLSDLAVVCANCHRIIHSRSPWFTMDELRELLRASNDR